MAQRHRYHRKDETTFDGGTLTLDLVEDILCRLPVKLLMQLRCVCKSWNSLISDPIFAKKHLHLSRTLFNRHHLISCPQDRSFQLWDFRLPSVFNASTSIPRTRLSDLPLDLNTHDGFYKVIGSCDGILCFSFGEYNNSVIVWNPSIRKSKKLPPLENQPELELEGFNGPTVYGFGHDRPRFNGETVFGFGYDHLTDSYKVVAFYCYKVDGRSNWVCKKVQVHTLGTNIWKTIPGLPSVFPFGSGFILSKCGIYSRGTVNWLGNTFSPSKPRVIFSFDLGNESYQELLPPDDGGVDVCAMRLGVLRDCLCILSHTRTFVIHVWLMEDYGNKDSWTKLFAYDEFFIRWDRTPGCPLYILDDDQLLLDFTANLAVYNSRNRTSKILKVESISGDICRLDNHVYIESLIPP